MKKSTIKDLTNKLVPLLFILLVTISCSSDDEKGTEVVFTSLEANKTHAFIEEPITLNLQGTGYTDVNVTSSNTKIKITKVASSVYEISSTEATNAKIYVELKNNSDVEIKNIDLTFAEHGVKNSNTVEGITVNLDNSAKVVKLLGEPDLKSDSTDGLSESWSYTSKGLTVIIVKKTTTVNQINMLSSNYFITNKENIKVNYTNYPYEIGYGWKVNSTTMDIVVNQLGNIATKSSTLTNRAYNYTGLKMVFRFYSDSEEDYTAKKIIYFSVY